jgi:uncharacterized RDD family membrane protein YckC
MKEKLESLKSDIENNNNYLRRLIAYGIDWYIGGVVASLPIIILYMMHNDNVTYIVQQLSIFTYPLNMIAGSLSFLVAVLYYVVVPACIWKGQTLGKKITHTKIICNNYQEVSAKQIWIRQGVMILLVQGSVFAASRMLHEVLEILTGYNISTIYAYIGLTITTFSVLLVFLLPSKRALHDIVANTRIVHTQSNHYTVTVKKMDKYLRKNKPLSKGAVTSKS